MYNRINNSFYTQPCEDLARNLLGKYIVRSIDGETKVGMITETEAYLGPHDKAAHSSKGRTPRTEVLFGQAGLVYTFLIYGIHTLLNITSPEPGAAVLIRAVKPVQDLKSKSDGPGKLTKALGINKLDYGLDLKTSDDLYIAEGGGVDFEILVTPRIGIDYAEEWVEAPLRFLFK